MENLQKLTIFGACQYHHHWQTRHVATEPFIMSETSPLIVVNEEDMFILRDWLSRTTLSPRERDWVSEGLFDGLKPREIAEIHDVAVSTVMSWRKGALKKLREEVNEVL